MDETIKDFEAALAELDGIVKKMEAGDLTLEASLALYERGVQLERFCHERLEAAERRIAGLAERDIEHRLTGTRDTAAYPVTPFLPAPTVRSPAFRVRQISSEIGRAHV